MREVVPPRSLRTELQAVGVLPATRPCGVRHAERDGGAGRVLLLVALPAVVEGGRLD